MNPIIISAIISAATFILTIFSAIYLNQRHTDKLIEQLEKRLDEQGLRFDTKVDELSQRFELKVDELSRRFEMKVEGLSGRMDAKFETVNARLDGVDRRLGSVELRLDRLEGAIFKPVLPGNA